MIDWFARHTQKVEREKREPLNVTREQWLHGKWERGSIWLWTIGAFGPPNSAPVEERRKDLQ